MKAIISICPHQFLLILIVVTTAIGCNKDEVDPIFVNKDIEPVVDIDGNIYPAVEIGSQTWMMENLKVAHYRNGDTVQKVTDPITWQRLAAGAWCTYDYDISYDTIYGKFYNGYAVVDERGLAPEGWHVPSLAEWKVLEDYLGGQAVAGGKMKESGLGHWRSPNKGATNSSSFTALPGGLCDGGGFFQYLGFEGQWWSSEGYDNYLYYKDLSYTLMSINGAASHRLSGHSVRCIKD